MEHLKDNIVKLYRKLIPIYKFSDNLKESDSLERQTILFNNQSVQDSKISQRKGLPTLVFMNCQTKINLSMAHFIRDRPNNNYKIY